MVGGSYDIDKTIAEVERLLNTDRNVSPALKAAFQVLITVVKLLTDRSP